MHTQVPAAVPSARAQALAHALAQTARTQHTQDPTLQPDEVQQAFALAQHQLATELGGSPRARLVAMTLVVLAAGAGLTVALFMAQP